MTKNGVLSPLAYHPYSEQPVNSATTFAFRIYRHNFWGVDQLHGDTVREGGAIPLPDGGETWYLRHPDVGIDDSFVRTMVAELRRLDVAALSLAGCQRITRSSIAAVAELSGLRFLDAFNVPLRDKDFAVLSKCQDLEVLNLAGTAIDGSVLDVLTDLPKLHTLHLGFTDLQPQCFESLPFHPALRTLNLVATRTGNTEARKLAQCGKLAELGLEETLITDPAVAFLRPLASRLTRLHLSYNRISEGCLIDLYELDALRHLQLRATHIDRASANSLLSALPHLGAETADGEPGLAW